MKKHILLIFITFSSLLGIAQNELGFYAFPQMTQVNNKANRTDDQIYTALPTIAYGFGVSWLHQFNKRAGHGPIRHGVTSGSMKIKKSLKLGIIYSAHEQKWRSVYNKNGLPATWEGKKRFDYLKIPVMGKLTLPINNKFNFAVFGGPQLSYLIKAEGGIVYWERREGGDYFDLPFSEKKYFNAFTVDAVLGFDIEYKISRWVHLIAGIRSDISLSTVENNERILNNYPSYGEVKDYDKERGNSHNTTVALILGFSYHFHHAEFNKTRY